MTMTGDALRLRAEAGAFVTREAELVDLRQWDDWLALFAEDAEFWVPAWDSEHEMTADPMTDLSLIYLKGRGQLADRVWRFNSGRSPASAVLPRTCHMVSVIAAESIPGGKVTVRSSWINHIFLGTETAMFGGRYEHILARRGDAFAIEKKTVVLINDYVKTGLDLYHI